MIPDLFGAYVPAGTWLHRLPAGVKLLALFVGSLALVMLRSPTTVTLALVIAVALVACSGAGLRRTLRSLRLFLVAMLFIAAIAAFQSQPWQGYVQIGTLLSLVLGSLVLTTTTTVDDLLDAVTRALRPLRPLGVDPTRVALSFSLVLRTIPLLASLAAETRDAARGRGLERDPRVWLTPFVIRSVAHARDLGDALHARGLGDD